MYPVTNELGKLKWVLIFLVLFIISFTLINGKVIGVGKLKEITEGIGILDIETHYSPEQAYDTLNLLGEKGREFYWNLLVYQDFLFPIVYTLFWVSIISYLYSKWMKIKKLLVIITAIPIIGGMCDITENILILIMLSAYPKQLLRLAYISNIFTVIKNTVALSSITLTLIGIIILIVKFIKRYISSN